MKHLTWSRVLIVIGVIGVGIGLKPAAKYLHPRLIPDDFVDVKVSFDDDGACDKKLPLLIEMKNNSRYTVIKIDTWVSVKASGHSTELMSPYHGPFRSDLILTPGQKHGYCWYLEPEINNKSFDYKLDKKAITFQ